LVPQVDRGLKFLVVVDPENAVGERSALRNEASVLGRVIAGAGVAAGPVALKTLQVNGAGAAGDAVVFRIVPGDGEGNGGIQQRAEVEGVMGELPEVIGVDQNI